MKNISDKTKKRLIVSVGLAVSIVLIILIAVQFKKEPVKEVDIPAQSTETNTAAADNQNPKEVKGTVKTPATVSEETQKDNGAVDTGTDQKIQSDVPEKPTEPSFDSTKEPSIEKVEPTKQKDKPSQTVPPSKPTKPEKKTGTKTQTSGGLPGFDNVPDGGKNQVIDGKSDGDINKPVGTMN
ncbi:MAG: DUF6550 family protein [Ruminiclostridium sp.]